MLPSVNKRSWKAHTCCGILINGMDICTLMKQGSLVLCNCQGLECPVDCPTSNVIDDRAGKLTH
jgi:hypothetical protein